MGQGGCWSLCSGVNSCTPLQGLITQVSLEILATETPGGRGAGNRTECNVRHVSAALLRKSSSSRTFLLERIYFTSLSKMPLSIFSRVCRDCKHLIKAGVFTRGELMLQTCCCLQRYKGDSFHEFPFGYILLSSITFSFSYFLVSTIFFTWFKQHKVLHPLSHTHTHTHSPPRLDKMYLCKTPGSYVFVLTQSNIRICKVYSCWMSCVSDVIPAEQIITEMGIFPVCNQSVSETGGNSLYICSTFGLLKIH